jgi:hypothetical protein
MEELNTATCVYLCSGCVQISPTSYDEKMYFFKTRNEAIDKMWMSLGYINGYAVISCPLCQRRLQGCRWKGDYKYVWQSGKSGDFRIIKENEPNPFNKEQPYRCPRCEELKLPGRRKHNQNWKAYCRRRIRAKFYHLHKRLVPFIPTKDIHSIIFDYLHKINS